MAQLILKKHLNGPKSLAKGFYAVSRLFSSSQRFLQSQEDGTWVHKLNDNQKVYHYGVKAGAKTISTMSTYNFRKPVKPEIFQQAVKQLVGLYPPYRMTIREKDDEPWIYLLPDMDVDFKVHPKGTPKFDIIRDIIQPYDEEKGPIFRFQLVEAQADDEFHSPEIKKEFPYQYYLFESMIHSVADGISHQPLAICIQHILNSLVGGNGELSLPPLPGKYLPPREFKIMHEQTKADLLSNPSRVDYLKDQMMRMNKPPLLYKYIPCPKVDKATTKHIISNIDQDTVNKFVMRSKENGITFGNAFQAVTNTALVDTVLDAGADDNSYDMSMTYTFNTRRFMKKRDHHVLGNHCRSVSSLITMQKETRGNFWKNCKMIQDINKDLINVDHVFEQEIIRELFLPSVPLRDFYKTRPKMTRDFGYNNVGVLEMTEKYNHVRMTKYETFFDAHRFIYPFYNQVHSYSGKLVYTLSYATDCLTDDTAHILAQKMKSVVEYHSQH